MQIIHRYITNVLHNPRAANNLIILFDKRISILAYFPQAGPKYKNTQYHYLTLKHWLIFYKVEHNIVKIYDIFSSKQNSENFKLS